MLNGTSKNLGDREERIGEGREGWRVGGQKEGRVQ